MVCEHLAPLEQALTESGARIVSRGQAWTRHCREWVYFDVILDIEVVRQRFGLPPCVLFHENTDPKSGLERGFRCTLCNDGVMGAVAGPRKVFP